MHKSKVTNPQADAATPLYSKESPPKHCDEKHTSFLGEGGGATAAVAARYTIKNKKVDGASKEERMDGGGFLA